MSLATNLQNAFTRVATEFKAVRVLIGGTGTSDISALTTTDKSSLVAAINEVQSEVGSGGGAASLNELTDVVITTPAAGHILRHDGTDWDNVLGSTYFEAAGAAEAVRTEILGTDVPAALDTLDELAAALGDDANFAGSVTTSLAGKQPLDATLTGLAGLTTAANQIILASGPDTFAMLATGATGRALLADATAADARAELSVYSQADIGDPTTDFVATFNAGLL